SRVQDEAHVEEAVLPVGVARLGLGDDEDVVLPGDLPEGVRLLARDVDGALAGESGVVEVEDLVVEGLERALREGDETHGNGEAREPGRRLHQVTEVVEVDLDVAPLADPAHGRDQPHRHVRLDHPCTSLRAALHGPGAPPCWWRTSSMMTW